MIEETIFGEMHIVSILEELYKDIDEEVFSSRIALIDGLLEKYIDNQAQKVNNLLGANASMDDEGVRKVIIASLIRSKLYREDSNNGFNRVLYFIFNNDTHNVEDIINIYDVKAETTQEGKTKYNLIVKE